MRLVNIKTLQLEEFEEGRIPQYAALSHRWTSEELNFKEVYKRRPDITKKGYKKLVAACQKAVGYDVEYIWIDTCCIDKSSSAELSEAINSMFAWYEESKVCLAYLEDVKAGAEFGSTFRGSVWFRRSWTLQELIAPRSVEFFDCNWEFIGSKISNARTIEEVTGISDFVLDKSHPISLVSIAEKMSWAAERAATRREDVAYSLLGIFDVNMPPLYGEGSKAFFRLQQEVMRHASDLTFLLWGQYNVLEEIQPRLLADCPAEFLPAKNQHIDTAYTHNPMTVTNMGIEMDVRLIRWKVHIYGIVVATGGEPHCKFALLVRKCVFSDAFYRIGVVQLPDLRPHALRTERKLLVVWGREEQLDDNDLSCAADSPNYGFVIETDTPFPIGPVKSGRPSSMISSTAQIIASEVHGRIAVDFGDPMYGMVAIVECKIGEQSNVSIHLTFDFDSNPVAHIHNDSARRYARQASDYTGDPSARTRSAAEAVIAVTTDTRTGHISGSLQGHRQYCNVFARVPRVLLVNDCELWISFIAPTSASNNSPGWWTFSISTHRPQIGYF